MTRKEFLQVAGILGVGVSLSSALPACEEEADQGFTGKVLIIGAGAGGLSAAYLLQRAGIDFQILEASGNYGGRMKINTDFADFPLPLGAEWLHAGPDEFQKIVEDTEVNIATAAYNPATDTYAHWNGTTLSRSALEDTDLKLVDYSWFNFFEDYVIPSIADQISYNQVVESIDYSGTQIQVQTQAEQFTADRVIVAVPLQILQDATITFNPALPSAKMEAIADAPIWAGFKAFIEFSEPFYDTQIGFDISSPAAGQKLYYDAAYGQPTSRHIIGLFAVGEPAEVYQDLSGDALRDYMLEELDQLYDNQASATYLRHIVQNWKEEPFIGSGYLSDEADWRLVRELGRAVAAKIYFAGGPYTDGEDWVSVHVAAQSARNAVAELRRG